MRYLNKVVLMFLLIFGIQASLLVRQRPEHTFANIYRSTIKFEKKEDCFWAAWNPLKPIAILTT